MTGIEGPEVRADLGPEALERVRELLLARPASAAPTGPGRPAAADMFDALRSEYPGMVGDSAVVGAMTHLEHELSGLGPLQPLLATPGICDILVAGPAAVWIDAGAGLQRSALGFADDAAVRRLACRLANRGGRRLDDAQPWVEATLTDVAGSGELVRLHAVLAPIAQPGTCISLRVLRPARQGLAELVALGAVPPEIAELLGRIVAARAAFLVCGATGAGKTTLLAALLGEVAPSERIICIEDAPELAPQHPHVVRLATRESNVEGRGEITARDLVRQSLRMRPDRVIVGEVRGAEIVDLLAALNTGHDGGAGTIHANNPREVPARIEALGALAGLSRSAVHAQLAAAISVVIGVTRDTSGRRAIGEIGYLLVGDSGLVHVEPAWQAGLGAGPAAAKLEQLLRERSCPP